MQHTLCPPSLWRLLRCVLPLFALAAGGVDLQAARAASPGPFPADIAAWPAEKKEEQRAAGQRMLDSLRDAAKAGRKTITVPKGDYRFGVAKDVPKSTGHIVLGPEFDGVTIDFQGSSLWFDAENSGIVFARTRGATVKNVKLDWDPLPFIQGVVTRVSAEQGTFDVKLDPGYERVGPALADTWRGRGILFDPKTRELKAGQHGCEVTFSWAARQPDGSYRLKFHGFHGVPLSDSGIKEGDPYVMLRRLQRAVRLEGASDITLEDVTLYSAPFIGFVASGGSAATFRRCNILRRPGTNRLIAGNADGINCGNMEKGPLIEDCRMETLGDDFINVFGHLARVVWQEAPDKVLTTMINTRGAMKKPVTLEFLDRKTMRSLGKREATWTTENRKIEADHCLADLKHRWHSGQAAALADGATLQLNVVTLDRPLKIEGDVIVICEALSSAGAIIRNNKMKGSLARGFRLQSPDVLVENNTVERTCGPSLTLGGQASFWGEGPYVYDAIIRKNKFIDASIGAGGGQQRGALIVQEAGDYRTQRLSRRIRIEGNTITRSGGSGIIARGSEDLVISKNRIERYGVLSSYSGSAAKEAPLPGAGSAIVVEAAREATLLQNDISGRGPHAQGPSIALFDVND